MDHSLSDKRVGSQSVGVERGGGTREAFVPSQRSLHSLSNVGTYEGVFSVEDLSQESMEGVDRIQIDGAESQLDTDEAECEEQA